MSQRTSLRLIYQILPHDSCTTGESAGRSVGSSYQGQMADRLGKSVWTVDKYVRQACILCDGFGPRKGIVAMNKLPPEATEAKQDKPSNDRRNTIIGRHPALLWWRKNGKQLTKVWKRPL